MESDLILSAGGLPPFSARGCVQKLTPIKSGRLVRTINGKLIHIGGEEHQKYRSTIACEDKAPFASEGLWKGREVQVGCIQRLSQKISGRIVTLEREPVDGSVVVFDAAGQPHPFQQTGEREITLDEACDGYVSYRPWLRMRVDSFTLNTDEWGLKAGWRLELEEI